MDRRQVNLDCIRESLERMQAKEEQNCCRRRLDFAAERRSKSHRRHY